MNLGRAAYEQAFQNLIWEPKKYVETVKGFRQIAVN